MSTRKYFSSNQPQSLSTAFPAWFPYFTTDISGNAQANFFPGTIGGILPSNMLTPLTLDQVNPNYIYAQMTATAGNLTGATLVASTSYPTLANATSAAPPATFNLPIGLFEVPSNNAFSLVGFGAIWVEPFIVFFDTINTGTLLTAPFTPWYNWQWGAGN